MRLYSERAHQEALRMRLRARNSGYAGFHLTGHETIPGLFSRQVGRHPTKIAIATEHGCWTYEQLERRAQALGNSLLRDPDADRAPFALLLSQLNYFAAAVLGILRSGGAYIPLDPSFPEDRNRKILSASGARVILTERANLHLAQQVMSHQQRVLCVEDFDGTDAELADASRPDSLAYIIFTSGSTGHPKGVMQTTANLLQVARRYTDALFVGEHDRVSLLSSCSVTASVAPLLSALLNGATLLSFSVRDKGLNALADWLDSSQITLYHSVPSLFRHLLSSVAADRVFSSVQVVRMGGDSVYRTDWQLFMQHFPPDTVLVNSYGCSEMSSVARFYIDAKSQLTDEIVPVGYPANDDVRIAIIDDQGTTTWVDEQNREPSQATVGEIGLVSKHLSPGYWNDPNGTALAFSQARDASPARLYRTGDLGVIRGAQGLVHVGRADSQVKMSGFRVEIAEVEACLRSCPGVKEGAVLLLTGRGGSELIGFVELARTCHDRPPDIRSYVEARLPGHMVPSQILTVESMPCTPNGKIDRGALALIRDNWWQTQARQAPTTAVESVVAEIWRQVLKVEQLGVDDNFFELGGNSLRGMEAMAKLAAHYRLGLRATAILQSPTIRELSQAIERSLLLAGGASSIETEYDTGVV